MSADLLAEFESFYQPPKASSRSSKPKSAIGSALRNNATDEETLAWWGALDPAAQSSSDVQDVNVAVSDLNLLDGGLPAARQNQEHPECGLIEQRTIS